jgi:hypothetical protein
VLLLPALSPRPRSPPPPSKPPLLQLFVLRERRKLKGVALRS